MLFLFKFVSITKMQKLKHILFLILMLIFIGEIRAQIIDIKSFKDLDLLNSAHSFQDTVKKKTPPKPFVMKKSPLKAVLFSAILPGAGQFYNESYWKLPIVALAGGYFGYEIINQNNIFLDFRDQYIASQTAQNPSGNSTLLTQRDFYRDQRDRFIFYFGIFYLINLVDAYVDAELYDFDVSDKVRFGIASSKINLKISF